MFELADLTRGKSKARSRLLMTGTLLAAFAIVSPAGAQQGSRKPWTYDSILKLHAITEPQISPDGRLVVFVVSEADEAENVIDTELYLATIPKEGAQADDAVRLTRSTKPDHSPRWRPGGDMIAFLSGRNAPDDDKKNEQVWLIRPDGGEAWRPGKVDGSVTDVAWSPDGRTLALLAMEPKSPERKKREKEKDDATVVRGEIRRAQVWLMDAGSGAVVQVTRGPIHFTDLDWSPDGTRLALAGQPSPEFPYLFESDIYVLDLAQARAALREAGARGVAAEAPVDPNAPPPPAPAALATPKAVVTTRGSDVVPRWSPSGDVIAYDTQNGSDDWFTNDYVAIVPAKGGEPEVLSGGFDERVENIRFAPDGKALFFEADVRLARHLYRINIADDAVAQQITSGDDQNRSFSMSHDGRRAAFVHESALEPMEVHVAEFGGAKGPPFSSRPLTRLNAWTSDYVALKRETFRWKGAGGMEMEGILIRPEGLRAGEKPPLLTVVHGGPAGFFNNIFTVRRGAYPVQIFAQRGFAVLMPNPRGSGAYGEAFRKANVRDWGGKDYEDIMLGIDAAIAQGLGDPDRLGIMGWSYGGFMTSRVITKTHRFKAASVGAGVTNTFAFTGVTDIPAFMKSYFGAWPWDDPEVYTTHTALFSAKGVTTPTLIQHGDADARVPLPQGWELYVALREQGVPVEFVTYPRQGHAFDEPKLIRDAMKRNEDWFAKWILGEGRP